MVDAHVSTSIRVAVHFGKWVTSFVSLVVVLLEKEFDFSGLEIWCTNLCTCIWSSINFDVGHGRLLRRLILISPSRAMCERMSHSSDLSVDWNWMLPWVNIAH